MSAEAHLFALLEHVDEATYLRGILTTRAKAEKAKADLEQLWVQHNGFCDGISIQEMPPDAVLWPEWAKRVA